MVQVTQSAFHFVPLSPIAFVLKLFPELVLFPGKALAGVLMSLFWPSLFGFFAPFLRQRPHARQRRRFTPKNCRL